MGKFITIEEEMESLTRAGHYSDKEEVLKDAFRALLESRPELRISIAAELYKEERISLNRAARIAGVTAEEMKELLRSRGIELKRGFTKPKERRAKAEELAKLSR